MATHLDLLAEENPKHQGHDLILHMAYFLQVQLADHCDYQI